MKKILGLLATGCLAFAANTASAIPLDIEIHDSGLVGGDWELTGPTSASDSWSFITFDSWSLDIDPGNYVWEIFGGGVGSVSWTLTLANNETFSGSAEAILFTLHGDTSARFTAVPEPGTLAMLGIGLLAIGFAVTRRRVGLSAGQPA